MEDRGIDLQKFAPKKANKWYIIKIFIYALVLAGLLVYLLLQLKKGESQKLDKTIVDRVKIDVDTN